MENLSKEIMIELVNKIKQKKELKGVADAIVYDKINFFLSKNPKILKNILESKNLEKSSSARKCIKEVRAFLRKISGSFEIDNKNREVLIEQNKISEVLATHSSTKERLDYYSEIYDKIFLIAGKPKSVLDIGCGLNPLSFPDKKAIYYACDINKDNLALVQKYFEKNSIEGKQFFCDLTKTDNSFPKADICFLFKILDIIESKGHKMAEKIISSVPCKYIVVSFSTKTLSGRKMNNPRRIWLERMLGRLKLKWTFFEVENEEFYVIEKNSY